MDRSASDFGQGGPRRERSPVEHKGVRRSKIADQRPVMADFRPLSADFRPKGRFQAFKNRLKV